MLSFFYNRDISRARKILKKLGTLEFKKKLDLEPIGVASSKKEIILNPNDVGLSAELLAYGFREPINCNLLSQFIKKKNFDVVIDAGSNIGYFPIIELESGAKKVVVIEPVPETFSLLHKNVEKYPNVIEFNVAVSVDDGEATLFIPPKKNRSTIIRDKDYFGSLNSSNVDEVKVPTLSLQTIIDKLDFEKSSILLRMDIEGYESIIGYNLPEEIKGISLEFHSPIFGIKESMKLLNHWEENGFRAVMLSRELNGLCPFIKRFGLSSVLRMYEIVYKRKFVNPKRSRINHIVSLKKESPHIFLLR